MQTHTMIEQNGPTLGHGIDISQLINMAKRKSQQDRDMLALGLSDMCLASGRKLKPREQAILFDIISSLVDVVTTKVKSNLSEGMAERDDVPKDLLMNLAHDVIEVAYPVILKSRQLEDNDLIKLILEKEETHQIAVSQRDNISEKVSNKLVETDNTKVIKSLLTNETADISEQDIHSIVEKSEHDEDMQRKLMNRNELNNDLAKKLYSLVGDTLRGELMSMDFDLVDEDDIDEVVNKAVEDALNDDDFDDVLVSSVSGYTGYPHNPRMLVKCLEEGDVFRFEELFREMTDLSAATTTRILYDSGPEALAIACKANRIEDYIFGDILCHLRGGSDSYRYRQKEEYAKAMDYYRRIDGGGAVKVLKAWRETPAEAWD